MRKNLTDNERLIIIEEYLRSDLTKYAICKKHGLSLGCISRWLSIFGLEDKPQAKLTMKKNTTPSDPELEEIQRLKSENRQLKARLKQEELGHKAYKMLVEMAEETYDIEIRKKLQCQVIKRLSQENTTPVVSPLCRLLGISRQGYYKRLSNIRILNFGEKSLQSEVASSMRFSELINWYL